MSRKNGYSEQASTKTWIKLASHLTLSAVLRSHSDDGISAWASSTFSLKIHLRDSSEDYDYDKFSDTILATHISYSNEHYDE